MMGTLARYIGGRILARFLLIVLAAAAFAISVDLMNRADKILAAHGGHYGAVLRYAGLRLPGLVVDLAPVAALLAALLALGDLLRHRELVATWDMGVSPPALMAKLLPLGLALGAAQVALSEAVVPWAAGELDAMGFRDERQGVLAASAEGPLWIRYGPDVVRIAQGGGENGGGGAIGPISIFRLDDGLLVERLDARRVEATADGWRLEDVVRYNVTPATVERLDEVPWPPLLDPEYLGLLAADARALPFAGLLRVLTLDHTGSRPASLYATWALYRVVSPLEPALMIMLAVALAQRFERTGGLARLLIVGGAVGFGFFVLDRAAVALGEVDAIPPWIAATGASLALAGLIAWLARGRRGLRGTATA